MSSFERLTSQALKIQKYDLEFCLNPEVSTFTLKEKITINLQVPTKLVKLHSKNLDILSIKDQNGELLKFRFLKNDVLAISLAKINEGKLILDIAIQAEITPTLEGIYQSKTSHSSVGEIILATQLESHYARELFVCLDEPASKSVFQTTIIHPQELVCLNNTEIIGQVAYPVKDSAVFPKPIRTVKTDFAPTPIMSTYLFCLVLGNLKKMSATTKSGILVSVYATADKITGCKFALDIATACLDLFEEFFDIKYPLEKCDLVSLPDFQSGAMENWGLITFRESCILVNEHTSLQEKQYVAMVVAHELAHQWFGNLVTMEWWTDLWLNEGFASFIEYLAIAKLFPQWRMWEQFITNEKQIALGLDSLNNSHPVEVKIDHPDEIRIIFDAISYSKGASIIYMLYDYLGEEVFRIGISKYLKKYSFSNACTLDLWRAMEESSGVKIQSLMSAWTSQTGFPVLSVTDDKITQRRYFSLSENSSQLSNGQITTNEVMELNSPKQAKPTIWPIPINFSNSKLNFIFNNFEINFQAGDSTINPDGAGFYLTQYSDQRIHNLLNKIPTELPELSSQIIISDLIFLIKSGDSDQLSILLNTLDNIANSKSFLIWDEIAHLLLNIDLIFANNDRLAQSLKKKVQSLIQPLYLELFGKEFRDDYFLQLLQNTIIGLASHFSLSEFVSFARESFDLALSPEDLNPNLRSKIYHQVAKANCLEDYEKMLDWYRQIDFAQEQQNLFSGIANFVDKSFQERNFKFLTTELRSQDYLSFIACLLNNKENYLETYTWIKNNYTWLRERIGEDLSFSRLAVIAAKTCPDLNLSRDYQDFFSSVEEPSNVRAIKQGLEIFAWRKAWFQRDWKIVKDWVGGHISE